MRMAFSEEIQNLLTSIQAELGEDQDLYLVGGAVRDALLGRSINDLDFVMEANPTKLAKMLAKRFKAGFFVLDDERHTARVLHNKPDGERLPLDFVQFTGGSLEEDLRSRDFTINAMALSLRDLSQVIDPLDGRCDLVEGLLRICSAHALLDDPVRILRGIRLALQFNLEFSEMLPFQMQAAAKHLPETSFERQRDEFFKILEGSNPASGINLCRKFGIFKILIPALTEQEEVPASPPHALPLFEHTIATVEAFHQILDRIYSEEEALRDPPWWLVDAASELSSFVDDLKAFFSEEITPGRSKRGLAIFGTLLHDIGKPLTMKMGEDDRLHYDNHAKIGADLAWDTARHLRLSNAEASWVRTMVQRHMALLPFVNKKTPLSRQAIYQFFKEAGEVGVAIGILTLADMVATFGETLSKQEWQRAVQVTRDLLTAWWERQAEIISPSLLLDGNDLQKEFGLAPGKQIGRLLDALQEAQAVGKVSNKQEAKTFVQSQLDQAKRG